MLAPLNPIGHKTGAKLTDAGVVAAPGLSDAYRQFVEGGWMGLAFPEAFGGQGLPKPLALAVFEMIHGANMAFGLCPLLSFGAIEALLAHGSEELQQTYLPKLISGEWTGAMNLTEPQAGSDVGALVTKAVPNGDGSYAITGQKIFITWGDHDMTPNIIQLVLARLPDAPAGSKGISLFVAPKFFVNADGSLGERNSFKCIGLEHKMGIHASPTCVMEYSGAKGWLVGEPNKGLAAMFTMMNSARLNVGLEGVAVGEAALQAGVAYAQDRKQGAAPGVQGSAPIIHHPDVQRMLATMASGVQAARAICYACGAAADLAEHHPDEAVRKANKAREDLLTPLAKAWSTDRSIEVTNLGVQIHGGMGFMSETAAAQYYLDARITPIYEGTNGIQAMDLVGRKLSGDGGAAMAAMLADVRATAREARATNQPKFVGDRGPAGRRSERAGRSDNVDAERDEIGARDGSVGRDGVSGAGGRRGGRLPADARRAGRAIGRRCGAHAGSGCVFCRGSAVAGAERGGVDHLGGASAAGRRFGLVVGLIVARLPQHVAGACMKFVAIGFAALAFAACATMGGAPMETAADAKFRAIYEAEWTWRQSLDPEEDEDTVDEDKMSKTWGRVDPATQAERLGYMKDVMAKLDALNASALTPEAQINLSIYREQIAVRMSAIEFREYEKPLNADSTFWTGRGEFGAEGVPVGGAGAILYRAAERHAALFRGPGRQHEARAGARVHAAACDVAGTRRVDLRSVRGQDGGAIRFL